MRWSAAGPASSAPQAIHILSGRAANELLLRTKGVWVFANHSGELPTHDEVSNERRRLEHPDYKAMLRSWGRFEALFCGTYSVDTAPTNFATQRLQEPFLVYVEWVAPMSRVVQRVTEFHVHIRECSSGQHVATVVVDNPSKPTYTASPRSEAKGSKVTFAQDTPSHAQSHVPSAQEAQVELQL